MFLRINKIYYFQKCMKLVNKKQRVSFNVKLRKTKAAFVLKPVNFAHYF